MRHALDGAELRSGVGAGAVLDLSQSWRAQPWQLDLRREGERLLRCEQRSCVLRGQDGKHKAVALGCGSRICPVCGRLRAARATARWRAVHEAAASDGAELWHVTLTQPAHSAPGGLVTAPEARRGWTGVLAEAGAVAPPVGGEGLGDAYTRLMEALRDVRQDRGSRDLWTGIGTLRGVEYTGRDPSTHAPRWHAHAHLLLVVPEGRGAGWMPALTRAWCRRSGGRPQGQHARRCDAAGVVEVLKYPFKPAHLTSAQRIETLAYARGLKPHHCAGAWSPQSRAWRDDPRWARWLSARVDPPPWQRLHYLAGGGVSPQLYTGQVTEGTHRWSYASSGGDPFEAPAEPFARLIGREIGDYPEPGTDMELELERDDGDDLLV